MWCTMLFFLVYMSGCASMTKAQLKRVNNLAVVSDSSMTGPGSVLRLLDEVRLERGLMYAASLQGTETHIQELNGLADAVAQQNRLAEKSDVCINILESYIRALLNAHLFYIAERYDIRSGKTMKTMGKFYMVDASLHNYITGIRPEDESRLLESKVFFELVRRGYKVCNGKLDSEEVHLVAMDERGRFYVQVVNDLNEENRDNLISPLRRIRDNHPKFVIAFNGSNEVTTDGIIILNALEFLMGRPLSR